MSPWFYPSLTTSCSHIHPALPLTYWPSRALHVHSISVNIFPKPNYRDSRPKKKITHPKKQERCKNPNQTAPLYLTIAWPTVHKLNLCHFILLLFILPYAILNAIFFKSNGICFFFLILKNIIYTLIFFCKMWRMMLRWWLACELCMQYYYFYLLNVLPKWMCCRI